MIHAADPRRDARALRLRARDMSVPRSRPLDVLHREELPLVAVVVELVDLDDVRVVEARRELRLLDEHRAEAPRRAVRREDALDDEDLVGALGAALLREEHLGHAARAEAPDDLELRELARRCRSGGALGHACERRRAGGGARRAARSNLVTPLRETQRGDPIAATRAARAGSARCISRPC